MEDVNQCQGVGLRLGRGGTSYRIVIEHWFHIFKLKVEIIKYIS